MSIGEFFHADRRPEIVHGLGKAPQVKRRARQLVVELRPDLRWLRDFDERSLQNSIGSRGLFCLAIGARDIESDIDAGVAGIFQNGGREIGSILALQNLSGGIDSLRHSATRLQFSDYPEG